MGDTAGVARDQRLFENVIGRFGDLLSRASNVNTRLEETIGRVAGSNQSIDDMKEPIPTGQGTYDTISWQLEQMEVLAGKIETNCTRIEDFI